MKMLDKETYIRYNDCTNEEGLLVLLIIVLVVLVGFFIYGIVKLIYVAYFEKPSLEEMEAEKKRLAEMQDKARKDKEYLDNLPKAQREKVLAERQEKEDIERRRRIEILQERELQAQIARRNDNTPRCPICGSSSIKKISLTNKATSVAVFGVLSAGHISKTYKCNKCGSKF